MGRHRHGHRTIGLHHRRLVERRIDGLESVTIGVKHLVEGFNEVLQQVKAIRDLDRVGGALPGSVRICSRPIPGDHADARMGLYQAQ